jgi:Raf kinase inhibitor-like YbhB/YbcL family protein
LFRSRGHFSISRCAVREVHALDRVRPRSQNGGHCRGPCARTSAPGQERLGQTEYGGPKPPSGEHRYFFRLFALDDKIDLPRGSSRQEIEKAMRDHVLDTAELMGRYAAAA